MALNSECRQTLGQAWSAYLDLLMEQKMSDGTPLLQVVLALNPDLHQRLIAAMSAKP